MGHEHRRTEAQGTWALFFQQRGVTIPPLPEGTHTVDKIVAEAGPNLGSYPWGTVTDEIARLAQTLEQEASDASGKDIRLTVQNDPPAQTGADIAIPCFPLAPANRMPPAAIAQRIAGEMTPLPYVSRVFAHGPYLNFELDIESFASTVIHGVETLGDNYGNSNEGNGRTVVLDYSSPNVAKYMSIGHLRSTAIGESLKRLYRAAGYNALGDNHIGDWGTQFGMLGRAVELWGNEPQVRQKLKGDNPVQGLYELYVRMEAAKEQEQDLERQGREWFLRLEQGDPEALALLHQTTEWSLQEFQRMYRLLGTEFDYVIGESFYTSMVPDLVKSLVASGVAQQTEGQLVTIPPTTEHEPPLIIQTSDGRSQYGTRDLATLAARTAWFDPEKIIYVVGNEQANYFKQVFAAFDAWTEGTGPQPEHVRFGMVRLPEGKMSTRKGRVFFLEDAVNELINNARVRLQEGGHVPADQIETVARQVGVGALIFLDLHQGRERDIDFNPEEALSLEGNTGPYVQYTHARACGLLKKAEDIGHRIDTQIPLEVMLPVERELTILIAQLPHKIQDALAENQPSTLARYLLELTNTFNSFYNQAPITVEDNPSLRNTRLRLTRATAQVIKNGLYLLGIEAPERM